MSSKLTRGLSLVTFGASFSETRRSGKVCRTSQHSWAAKVKALASISKTTNTKRGQGDSQGTYASTSNMYLPASSWKAGGAGSVRAFFDMSRASAELTVFTSKTSNGCRSYTRRS